MVTYTNPNPGQTRTRREFTGTKAYLGGVPLPTSPEEIRWDFAMKVQDYKTMGGKVIQILGTTLGDMTLSGKFGTGPKGEEPWQVMMETRERIKAMTREQYEGGVRANPIRFVFPPRNWDFQVYIKKMSPQPLQVTTVAPTYEIVLHIEDEGARRLVKDIQDAYIKRLMAGVGWKESSYNGPTLNELEGLLQGRSIADYLHDYLQEAFDAGLPGGSLAPPDDSGAPTDATPEGEIPGVTP